MFCCCFDVTYLQILMGILTEVCFAAPQMYSTPEEGAGRESASFCLTHGSCAEGRWGKTVLIWGLLVCLRPDFKLHGHVHRQCWQVHKWIWCLAYDEHDLSVCALVTNFLYVQYQSKIGTHLAESVSHKVCN